MQLMRLLLLLKVKSSCRLLMLILQDPLLLCSGILKYRYYVILYTNDCVNPVLEFLNKLLIGMFWPWFECFDLCNNSGWNYILESVMTFKFMLSLSLAVFLVLILVFSSALTIPITVFLEFRVLCAISYVIYAK